MYATFNQLKALNPKITNIMYLNSMFDFSMYNLHGQALALEAAGTRVLLRDKKDELVLLCNDGNYFCSKPSSLASGAARSRQHVRACVQKQIQRVSRRMNDRTSSRRSNTNPKLIEKSIPNRP